jgi:hypothetical protein
MLRLTGKRGGVVAGLCGERDIKQELRNLVLGLVADEEGRRLTVGTAVKSMLESGGEQVSCDVQPRDRVGKAGDDAPQEPRVALLLRSVAGELRRRGLGAGQEAREEVVHDIDLLI